MTITTDLDVQPTTQSGFSGFLQRLSGYYSQFLETDFKTTREPKRKYAEKQGQMRVGIQLSSYPRLQEKLISKLSAITPSPLKIKHGQYSASLPNTIQQGINAAIRSVSTEDLHNHPAYKVDFLIRLSTEESVHQAVIEYDGFEFHFDDRGRVDAGNWQFYLTANDVERECVLESFGYKMLRINRFNVGRDPVETLDQRLSAMFEEFSQSSADHQMVSTLKDQTKGLVSGELKTCVKCGHALPVASFRDPSLKSGFGRNCHTCKQEAARTSTMRPKRRRRRRW